MRNWNAVASTMALALSLAACKDTAHEPEDSAVDVIKSRHSSETERYAADAAFLQKNANFFFQVWDESFTRKLDDLPESGEVPAEKRPRSGGYYGSQAGGTDIVMSGGRSPLAKYDEAFHGGDNLAAAWERQNHTSGPDWAGHCNGFAAAAQRHKEPTRSVVKNGVAFDPKDIKALLAEVYMSADYEFLGGNRCDNTGNAGQPSGRVDPTTMGECEDINPGTLHAAITNWIGRMKHTLTADMNRGEQVWNHPVYKYAVTNIEKNLSEAQARQYVTGGGGSDYVFNPAAAKFAFVQMTLTYAETTANESIGKLIPLEMNLAYVLELDAQGEIIGGEWVGRSVQEHPDFLWAALEPMTPNGTQYMGNPNVDAGEVIKLWAESVGYDPDAPPTDIKRPSSETSWGKWATFEVTLDGNRNGAVFAGKPAMLAIKRKDNLAAAGVELDVLLNGDELKSFAPAEAEDLRYAFEPGLGLNRFQFLWKKDGSKVEDRYLRFHVVR